mmetsp:Transcript_8344/g.23960  ORF Transcript_8344/g.23960 Transcript_8344/m.23960 type:complete len:606 (-) Transcript_8344:1321-3138(-)|eukprot:CAMPEP_0118858020 /NCGR_PEP_ID=MMETSP1163-20130328/4869_1 /TAXON_ID=124430 /ORGANISM="Phaeomonas parva, Strain CCMP2877" /LENGTH=605 /DNA_ID=CAMNT_0006791423 /DNA_START=628 /DNA_END=2445 /DNA_ORIENTATION=+
MDDPVSNLLPEQEGVFAQTASASEAALLGGMESDVAAAAVATGAPAAAEAPVAADEASASSAPEDAVEAGEGGAAGDAPVATAKAAPTTTTTTTTTPPAATAAAMKTDPVSGKAGIDASASASNEDFSNLIVNYLPNDCGEEELRAIFAPHGDIETTKVVRDRATAVSCGYGFVKYATHEAAAAALAEKQGYALRGKRLKVSVALGPGRGLGSGEFPQNNLIVNYLTHDITEEKLLRLFSAHGEVESVKIVRDRETGMSLCYGFVKFKKDESAAAALEALNGLDIGQKRLKVSVARPASGDLRNNKLYVSYIPKSYTKDDVCRLFNRFGRILECRLLYHDNGESRCTAFVHMATKQAAEQALVMHGVQLQGTSRGMVVKMAHNKNARAADVQQQGPGLYYGGPRIMAVGRGGVDQAAAQLQGIRISGDNRGVVMPAPYIMHPNAGPAGAAGAGGPQTGAGGVAMNMGYRGPGARPVAYDGSSSAEAAQYMNYFTPPLDANMGLAPPGVMPNSGPYSNSGRMRARMPVAGMPYPSGAVGYAQPPHAPAHPPVHHQGQYGSMPLRGPVPPQVHPSVHASYPAMAPYPTHLRSPAAYYDNPEQQTETA